MYKKSDEAVLKHINNSTQSLKSYMESLVSSGNPGKADKLSYWLKDWKEYLSFEEAFDSKKLRRYKRGEIIKVNLGFNVGSEEGGLHYAVIVENNNPLSSPVLTIVPLTSVKATTDIHNLKPNNVYLGNELFTNINSKLSAFIKRAKDEIDRMKKLNPINPKFNSILHKTEKEIELCQRMQKEIMKMKVGSIALVGQITTVSKMRVYDPKTNNDVLSGVKLSNEKLDLIDRKISELFTNL